VRSTRRDFIAGAAALVTAAGCGLHGQSDQVETFGPGLVSGPSALDSTLTLGMPADGAARITIESFKRRTGVDVTVETFGTDDDLLLSLLADRLDFLLRNCRDTVGHITDLLDDGTMDRLDHEQHSRTIEGNTDLAVRALYEAAQRMRIGSAK